MSVWDEKPTVSMNSINKSNLIVICTATIPTVPSTTADANDRFRRKLSIIFTIIIVILIVAATVILVIVLLRIKPTSTSSVESTEIEATITTATISVSNHNLSFIQTIYPTGVSSSPYSVAVGDLDDGNQPDIVVANSYSNNVGVLLNTGNGTFFPQDTYSTGVNSGPHSVVIADLNSDNKLDIVFANCFSGQVGILLNTGNGTFFVQNIYSTGVRPYSLAVADFNADNKPDIIVANFGSNNVIIFINTGSGTFSVQNSYSTGAISGPHSVTVADLNNDNKPDIVVANYNANNVGVFLNTGTGTFSTQTTYSTGINSGPHSVVVGDLNNDNKLDIVVANFDSNDVNVLLNSGTGIFSTQTSYPTDSNPSSVALADMNNDNLLDIIVGNYMSKDVSILLNSGGGTFLNQTTYPTGSTIFAVAISDVNNDNQPDIIVANYGLCNVGVLLNS